jgi:hypothetical protein
VVIIKTKQINCEIWAPGGPEQEDQPESVRESWILWRLAKKYYINSLYNLPGEAPLVPEDNY